MNAGRIFKIKARIKEKAMFGQRYFRMLIEADSIAKHAKAGQFVNIKVSEDIEPLLRRPFSIHRVRGRIVEILYEVVGDGTRILSQRKSGEYLNIIGPLGNGFSPLSAGPTLQSILVAGGMGVAPLVFLAEKLGKIKNPASLSSRQAGKAKNLVLIGAKTKEHILCEKEFQDSNCSVKISTDDGSCGFRGRVTELLKNVILQVPRSRLIAIYACGPKPMLKEVSLLARQYRIPAQISLEAHMACGIGACLGCAVRTKEGYKRVCKEGPVFSAEEIVW